MWHFLYAKKEYIIVDAVQKEQIKKKLASAASMPKDVIMGASVVTVLGMSEVCIENYSGITEYTDTLVRIRTKHGQIQLKGSCLEIEFYTNDEMKITGSINLIEFQEGRNLR